MTALRHDQHVCAVKPLVLKHSEAQEIARAAHSRGLVVGVEYHKRFDDRSLLARRKYRAGLFGEFKLGTAWLLEKWYYRHSNFQNWMTTANSDAFTYIGCHYVDLVHFITGLLPSAVSVYGIPDHFPNGKEGFLWTDARVIWSNGACLNVQNALGFPDAAAGTNTQGLIMYCKGQTDGALLSHSDQYRGLKYSYTRKSEDPGATLYAEPSPDYFQYVELDGKGLVPVGYGYRSVEYIVQTCIRVNSETANLAERQRMLEEIDAAGIVATPTNSSYNELVIEAARESILNGGRMVYIQYRN
jgi:predicted dehydrogenase